MNLVRRNPRPVRSRSDLFNLMDNFWQDWPLQSFLGETDNFKALDRDFSPSIELKETENSYQVEVDIPGMKKQDIELHFENNSLYIKGEKKEENEKKDGERTHYTERFYGSFTRKIPFSEEVDAQKINAKYADGVLKIQLAKKPSDSPSSRSIIIQ